MSRKIAILTDSTSSLYNVDHGLDNIFLIDIPCFIGEKIYKDFEKKGDHPFYEDLAKTDLVPKTSQPSVGETLEKFDEIKELGFTDIVYLPLSQHVSGTYQNGFIAKDMVEGINVEVVDTLTTASILSDMAVASAKLAKEGKTVEEILANVEELKTKWGYYVTVDDLTSLVKNGRLSNAKSFIANLLRIKPVIKFTNGGKLVALKNVRHYKRALKNLVDIIGEEINPETGSIHIAYTTNTEDLEIVKELVAERFPNIPVRVYTLSSTVVAHVGLKVIGIGYVNY